MFNNDSITYIRLIRSCIIHFSYHSLNKLIKIFIIYITERHITDTCYHHQNHLIHILLIVNSARNLVDLVIDNTLRFKQLVSSVLHRLLRNLKVLFANKKCLPTKEKGLWFLSSIFVTPCMVLFWTPLTLLWFSRRRMHVLGFFMVLIHAEIKYGAQWNKTPPYL